jgi:hypothetical protein
MIYQGQEQHLDGAGTPEQREAIWLSGYNTDAELYKLIAKLNAIRHHAYKLDHNYVNLETYPIFRGGSELGFRKGVEGRQVVMLLSTQGENSTAYDLSMPVSYNGGTTVMDVLSCANYTVNDQSELVVPMDKGEPRVFFPTSLMPGSGLCGYTSSNISFVELKTKGAAAAMSLGNKTTGRTAYHVLFSLLLSSVVAVML